MVETEGEEEADIVVGVNVDGDVYGISEENAMTTSSLSTSASSFSLTSAPSIMVFGVGGGGCGSLISLMGLCVDGVGNEVLISDDTASLWDFVGPGFAIGVGSDAVGAGVVATESREAHGSSVWSPSSPSSSDNSSSDRMGLVIGCSGACAVVIPFMSRLAAVAAARRLACTPLSCILLPAVNAGVSGVEVLPPVGEKIAVDCLVRFSSSFLSTPLAASATNFSFPSCRSFSFKANRTAN